MMLRFPGGRTTVLFVFVAICCPVWADHDSISSAVRQTRESLVSSNREWDRRGAGPLCGVYSTCLALEMSGVQCSPSDYISVKHVGSERGSTPQEISSIVKSLGASARIISGMSALDLKCLEDPLIANVRSTPSSREYDHWVVVSYQDGNILSYDNLAQLPVKMSIAEFLGIWSGMGIVVSRDEKPVLWNLWMGRLILIQTGILVAVVLKFLLTRSKQKTSYRFHELTVILTVTILLTVVGMSIVGDGFHYFSGIQMATAPFQEPSFHVGTLEELRSDAVDDHALLIDARTPPDFRYGSITGAINIPVYASIWEIRDYLKGVNRDLPIFVFCQSEHCAYDETVARNLFLLGFQNITVCEEGWAEYRQKFL